MWVFHSPLDDFSTEWWWILISYFCRNDLGCTWSRVTCLLICPGLYNGLSVSLGWLQVWWSVKCPVIGRKLSDGAPYLKILLWVLVREGFRVGGRLWVSSRVIRLLSAFSFVRLFLSFFLCYGRSWLWLRYYRNRCNLLLLSHVASVMKIVIQFVLRFDVALPYIDPPLTSFLAWDSLVFQVDLRYCAM